MEERLGESRESVSWAIRTQDEIYRLYEDEDISQTFEEATEQIESLGPLIKRGKYTEAEEYTIHLIASTTVLLERVMEMRGLRSSREQANSFALGVYTKQERSNNKRDLWRERPVYSQDDEQDDIYSQLLSELRQVEQDIENEEYDALLHNTADLLCLAAIFRAILRNRSEAF